MVTWKLKASTFVPAFNVGGSPHVVVERRHRSPMANSSSKKSYSYAETGAGVVLPRPSRRRPHPHRVRFTVERAHLHYRGGQAACPVVRARRSTRRDRQKRNEFARSWPRHLHERRSRCAYGPYSFRSVIGLKHLPQPVPCMGIDRPTIPIWKHRLSDTADTGSRT
jgi:hypothetical protein